MGTADGRGLMLRRALSSTPSERAHWKLMGDVMDSSVRMGHARDMKTILVENYWGSRGTKRDERHEIVQEHGTVHTHHPTAPALQVVVGRCKCDKESCGRMVE